MRSTTSGASDGDTVPTIASGGIVVATVVEDVDDPGAVVVVLDPAGGSVVVVVGVDDEVHAATTRATATARTAMRGRLTGGRLPRSAGKRMAPIPHPHVEPRPVG